MLLKVDILVCREWLAGFWCVDHGASWVNLGAFRKRAPGHRKSVAQLPAAVKPADWKDIIWTRGIIELLESAAGGGMEHWTDVQHLGWWECWSWADISHGRVRRGWHRWWLSSHLWSLQLPGDESQHLEPERHERIIGNVRLDVQLSWTKKRQLKATTTQRNTRPLRWVKHPREISFVIDQFTENLLRNMERLWNREMIVWCFPFILSKLSY